ncbi:PilN domain-containing protein [Acanthopleuribacter pedis]|uniref:PilN domain-containing protein n=1 Tax=Acanthopleuribacter pedis TaxID=442870 RepID=A0A8J7U458_9BACT|nr:PilN domain-containing protein [Acanthopleuribacter pedis]MBO1319048.1 PilN domain-containing protein [Acanthopleuribacter pedis]
MKLELNLRGKGWGIAFNDRELRLAAIQNKRNVLSLTGEDVLEDYAEKSEEDVLEFIEDFQAKFHVKRADAYLVLPRNQVRIQMADFPLEAKENLDEVVSYQMANYFPGDLELWDFFPQEVARGEQLRVMIVAVKKEVLGKAFSYIRRWNLRLAGVTIDTFAVFNAFVRNYADQISDRAHMLFHFFEDGMEMASCGDGRLTSSTFIKYPDLTEEQPNFNMLVSELELGFSRARLEPDAVETYTWLGRPPAAVERYLKENLAFPEHAFRDGTEEILPPTAAPAFGAAVSAVLEKPALGLNMLPDNQRRRHKQLPVLVGSVVIAVVLVLMLGFEIKDYMALRGRYNQLEEQRIEVMARMNELAMAREKYDAKREEVEMFQRFQASFLFSKLLYVLANELPDDTYLTNLRLQNGNELKIRGESGDPFQVQRILRNVPFLVDIKAPNAITTGRRGDGKKKFNIDAKIKLESLPE